MMERMIRKIGVAAGASVLFFLAPAAHAVDGIALEAGHGDDSTSLIRFSITDSWRKRQPATREWRLAGYWEFSAGIWDNKDESTADIGITPVFRIERKQIYLEGAIGVHLVQTHISAQRTFSTALQFGDHIGAGFRFGPQDRCDFGVRVQHISNGGISSPNPGINFFLVRLQYELE
jgi:lipid A 3-O-deacylase